MMIFFGVFVATMVAIGAASNNQDTLTNGLLLADPKNCSAYYEFVPVLKYCPSGLVFNSKHQMCDWPANVDCTCNEESGGGGGGGGGGGNGGGEGGSGGHGGGGGGHGGNGGGGGGHGGNGGGEGGNGGHGGGGGGHGGNGGGEGGSGGHGGGGGGHGGNGGGEGGHGGNGGGEGGHGGNGGGEGGSGGNGGGEGNNNNSGGNQGGDCPTRGQCPAVDPLDRTVHLPHLNDCGLFCRCDHGVPKLDRCPTGLHFNARLEVCDWPNTAGCSTGESSGGDGNNGNGGHGNGGGEGGHGGNGGGEGGNGGGEGGNGGNGGGGGGNGGGEGGHGGNGGGEGEHGGNGGSQGGHGGNSSGEGNNNNGGDCPTRGKCPAVDPLDRTVHLPHLTDCGLFCRCDHGVPKLDRCPAGLHFNPKLEVCDWPNDAGCVIGVCQPLSNNDRSHWEPATCVSDASEVGDKCRLACNSEYQLSGSADLTCTEDGWTGATGIDQIPTCKTINETGEDFVNNINDTLGQRANLLFVLDESGSVSPSNFDIELSFVKAIINAFPLSENRSAGVITFDDKAAVDISIKESNTCNFLKGVDAIRYSGGGTDILRSLNLAYDEIIQNAIHNLTLVFLVTDGISSTNPTVAADNIKGHGDVLFTVGVAGYDDKQLAPLSSLDKHASPLFYGIKSFEVFNAVANYLATKYNNGTSLGC